MQSNTKHNKFTKMGQFVLIAFNERELQNKQSPLIEGLLLQSLVGFHHYTHTRNSIRNILVC